MNYTRYIQLSLDFIEKHLRIPVELEDVAAHASFSLYHFHRIFTNITGWTMKGYIRTRRLSEAGKDLMFSDASIQEIANRYQFESQAAFTRAFRRQFGLTPGMVRKHQGSFVYTGPYRLMNQQRKGDTMALKIVTLGEMKAVGMSCRTTMKENIIPQLWDRFNEHCGRIQHALYTNVAFGICPYVDMDEFTEHDEFEYIASVPVTAVDDLPDGLSVHTIPAATYAIFTHKGSLNNLQETYEKIFSGGLEGYELDEADQIEWYDERFKFGQPDSEMDIYIPIKR